MYKSKCKADRTAKVEGGSIGFLSNDTIQLWATRAPPLSIQQEIKR